MRTTHLVIISTTLLAFVYLSIDAQAAEDYEELRLGQPVFSDHDLEKYEKLQDIQTEQSAPESDYEKRQRINKEERQRAMEEKRRIGEEKQKERWCNRGNKIRLKIEKLRGNVQDREREIAGMSAFTSREMARKEKAQKNLERGYKRRLKEAEQTLTDAENEAYRKGIPMGWPRCQF